MKTDLTKEQSQHLLDLGVPKEKASGSLSYGFAGSYPIFKLEDFMNGEILPKKMEDKTWGFIYVLVIRWDGRENWWLAGYNGVVYFKREDLIDAIFELTCWYYGKYLKT